MKPRYGLILVLLAPLLASCEQLGVETPAAELAREEAEGKAIGSGCRQSARALEDCYQINRRASKAAIYAGWRDMDAYMRENKIEEIRPDFPMKPPPGTGRPLGAAEEAVSEEKDAAAQAPETAAKPAAGKDEKAAEGKPEPPAPAKPRRSPLAR